MNPITRQIFEDTHPAYTYNIKGIYHKVHENVYSHFGSLRRQSTGVPEHVEFHERPKEIPDHHFFDYITNEVIPEFGFDDHSGREMHKEHLAHGIHDYASYLKQYNKGVPTTYIAWASHNHKPRKGAFEHELAHHIWVIHNE